MHALLQQAENMLTNPKTREAFDLEGESERMRASYGKGHRGQCYLLGRKLIEAGVRFVTVDVREPRQSWVDGVERSYDGGTNMNWDHHDAIYSTSHTNIPGGGAGAGRWGIGTWPMMGSTDQALAALVEDMDQRGLLKETLVCFVTEFGRTPKINDRQGRDHWTHAFSFAFAGAGVPQVMHKTGWVHADIKLENVLLNAEGRLKLIDFGLSHIYPVDRLTGIVDRSKPLHTASNRPIILAAKGRPIPELFS